MPFIKKTQKKNNNNNNKKILLRLPSFFATKHKN